MRRRGRGRSWSCEGGVCVYEYPASGACEALLLFVSVVYPYNESMNPLLDPYSNELNAKTCEFTSSYYPLGVVNQKTSFVNCEVFVPAG